MSGLLPQHGEILLYDNGADKQFVSVVFKDETFWLTQSGMAELFDCSADNISLHLKNIYADGELEQAATTEKFSVVRKEGSREVRRGIDHYNLDTIIAVGYRVNSKKATPPAPRPTPRTCPTTTTPLPPSMRAVTWPVSPPV